MSLRLHMLSPATWTGFETPPPAALYFHHPIGYHHLLTLLIPIFGEHEWLARGVAVAGGLVALWALYALVRTFWSREAGLVAVAVYVALPVVTSFSVLSDPMLLAMACVLWSLWAYLSLLERPTTRALWHAASPTRSAASSCGRPTSSAPSSPLHALVYALDPSRQARSRIGRFNALVPAHRRHRRRLHADDGVPHLVHPPRRRVGRLPRLLSHPPLAAVGAVRHRSPHAVGRHPLRPPAAGRRRALVLRLARAASRSAARAAAIWRRSPSSTSTRSTSTCSPRARRCTCTACSSTRASSRSPSPTSATDAYWAAPSAVPPRARLAAARPPRRCSLGAYFVAEVPHAWHNLVESRVLMGTHGEAHYNPEQQKLRFAAEVHARTEARPSASSSTTRTSARARSSGTTSIAASTRSPVAARARPAARRPKASRC